MQPASLLCTVDQFDDVLKQKSADMLKNIETNTSKEVQLFAKQTVPSDKLLQLTVEYRRFSNQIDDLKKKLVLQSGFYRIARQNVKELKKLNILYSESGVDYEIVPDGVLQIFDNLKQFNNIEAVRVRHLSEQQELFKTALERICLANGLCVGDCSTLQHFAALETFVQSTER